MSRAPGPRAAMRATLLAHYDEHRRSLPWRGQTDPYRILVSEVMLQQTRVETVIDYYEAWLDRFPSLASLAAAKLDDVLEAWEGLGYYRRARNLHRLAQVVRERPDGSLPASYAELRELPGVGEYTAGAVASIAFGVAVPAPDGNVRRVLARLFDEPEPKPAWLRITASELVDPERPGDWNQALMELGATVCSPRRPECGRCPVARWCLARVAGTQEERPAATSRRAPRRALFAVAVLHHAGRVLLLRRPDEGLLGGLWALPEAEIEGTEEAVEAVTEVAGRLGFGFDDGSAERLPAREHAFTHLRATYVPFLVRVDDLVAPSAGGPGASTDARWVELAEPAGLAVPVAQRRILESAREHLARGVAPGSRATARPSRAQEPVAEIQRPARRGS